MEVEIKVPLGRDQLAELERVLSDLTISLGQPETQRDVYFKERGFRTKTQGPGSYLVRVRYAGIAAVLNMKRLTNTDGVWEETETEVHKGDVVEKIIVTIGAEHALTVEKTRRAGGFGRMEVIVDEVQGLGTFLELAIETSDDPESAQHELFGFLEKLGLDRSKAELRGYPTILLEREGVQFSVK